MRITERTARERRVRPAAFPPWSCPPGRRRSRPGPLALSFEPASLDDRIVNQHALVSVMSPADGVLDHWLRRVAVATHKIIIPGELKWEIRDRLDQSNLTERVFMPGLDGLSSWLERQYTAKARGR